MKMSYHILWVDDERSYVEESEEGLRNFLDGYGIKMHVGFIEVLEQSEGELLRTTMDYIKENPDVDLLLVDFRMPVLKGDALIDAIRREEIFLPAIFYSSADLDVLYEAVKEQKLDGVYIASRESFSHKAENVIKSLIKKEQTPKQTRGLLMEAVSDIEARLPDLIMAALNKADDRQRNDLHRYVMALVKEKARESEDFQNAFPRDSANLGSHFEENLTTKSIYGVFTKCRLMKKVLCQLDHDSNQVAILEELLANDSLIQLRNKYAHQTDDQLQNVHSDKRCISIRKEIRKQLENLEAIQQSLSQ